MSRDQLHQNHSLISRGFGTHRFGMLSSSMKDSERFWRWSSPLRTGTTARPNRIGTLVCCCCCCCCYWLVGLKAQRLELVDDGFDVGHLGTCLTHRRVGHGEDFHAWADVDAELLGVRLADRLLLGLLLGKQKWQSVTYFGRGLSMVVPETRLVIFSGGQSPVWDHLSDQVKHL